MLKYEGHYGRLWHWDLFSLKRFWNPLTILKNSLKCLRKLSQTLRNPWKSPLELLQTLLESGYLWFVQRSFRDFPEDVRRLQKALKPLETSLRPREIVRHPLSRLGLPLKRSLNAFCNHFKTFLNYPGVHHHPLTLLH